MFVKPKTRPIGKIQLRWTQWICSRESEQPLPAGSGSSGATACCSSASSGFCRLFGCIFIPVSPPGAAHTHSIPSDSFHVILSTSQKWNLIGNKKVLEFKDLASTFCSDFVQINSKSVADVWDCSLSLNLRREPNSICRSVTDGDGGGGDPAEGKPTFSLVSYKLDNVQVVH